jgi:hypothetical protein
MSAALHAGMDWLALALACAALAVATGAMLARSLFAMCMHLGAAGALTAAAVLGLGAGDVALPLALFAGAWAPVLLLAAMLLSARATRAARRRAPWFSILAAAAAGAGLWFIVPDLGPTAAPPPSAPHSALGAWLAPLILASAGACVGLLGYGERGAFQRRVEDES